MRIVLFLFAMFFLCSPAAAGDIAELADARIRLSSAPVFRRKSLAASRLISRVQSLQGNTHNVAAANSLASLAETGVSKGRIWTKTYRGWEDMRVLNETPGYRYQATGFNIGYDWQRDGWLAGAALGYARGTLYNDGADDDNRIRDYSVDFFASTQLPAAVSATMFAGYTYTDNKMLQRTGLGEVRSSYGADSWIVGAKVEKSLVLGGISLSLSLGLEYQYGISRDYNLKGMLQTQFRDMESKSLELPVMAFLSRTFRPANGASLVVSAGGGYSHEFYDDGFWATVSLPRLGGQSFSVQGTGPGKHSWKGMAAVKYSRESWDVSLEYSFSGRKAFSANTIGMAVGVKF